jgi:hypothetical protein
LQSAGFRNFCWKKKLFCKIKWAKLNTLIEVLCRGDGLSLLSMNKPIFTWWSPAFFCCYTCNDKQINDSF